MTTPKQAQEAALLAMIKQLLPEQEILGSEIETIYAAVDYIRELSAMLEWEYDIFLQCHNFSAHIYSYLLKTCATKLLENIQKLFKKMRVYFKIFTNWVHLGSNNYRSYLPGVRNLKVGV